MPLTRSKQVRKNCGRPINKNTETDITPNSRIEIDPLVGGPPYEMESASGLNAVSSSRLLWSRSSKHETLCKIYWPFDALFYWNFVNPFNGRNMTVKMFVERCRATILTVSSREVPSFTMLVKIEITSEARVHIQDRVRMKLDWILKALEQIYFSQEDASILLQDFSSVNSSREGIKHMRSL